MIKCEICGQSFLKKCGLSMHRKKCGFDPIEKDSIIKSYVEDMCSIRDLMKKYNYSKNKIAGILDGMTRSQSDSAKIAKIRYPFRHTENSKVKMRDARLKYMSENPDKTAWRKSNFSYPEKLFFNKLLELKWDQEYAIEREHSVYPYYIDFAFLNEKVAVEIDGSQHLNEDRKEKDEKKDLLLIENEWTVVRVTENEIKKNINHFMSELGNILHDAKRSEKFSFGIFKKNGGYQKRRINGKQTEREITRDIKARKVLRPDYETLMKDIVDFGFAKTGRKYGVSDNAIRKWVKYYQNH
jgi:very-short-patch-repair endonuclease